MSSLLNQCSRLSLVTKGAYKRTSEVKVIKRWNHVEKVKPEKAPIKFTSSDAHINYKSTRNFYEENHSLPKTHNLVLAGTGISAMFYLIFLRDDIENDGGVNLFKPIHETIPDLAIPMLQAAIIENRKFGGNTKKLEEKLAEYMKEPEKYGGERRKLIEN